MRAFIALDFGKEDYFKKIQDQIKSDNIKATFPKSFHLTLKFLGEVQEEKIKEITKALEKVKFREFKTTTNEIGVFPSESYIRVIWLGFKDPETIIALQKQIENNLKNLFQKDKGFHPHITLARVKFVKDKKLLKQLVTKIRPKQLEFTITKFSLYKSTLTKQGPVYEEIESFNSI